jgi:voltage-gated sodium channel
MEERKDAISPKTPLYLRICVLIDRPGAKRFILGVILFNSLILGLETSSWFMERVGKLLLTLDVLCLSIFTVEILMKLVVHRLSFFRSGWNIFDFLIVGISLTPGSGSLAILRALRILRILRLVANMPRLRVIVESVLYALPSIGWICGLLLIIFYIFSVLVTTLFGSVFPGWFGSIGASMYTLFQMLTMDSWSSGIARPVMEQFPHAYLVFIPFILVTSFIVLNVFIGVIVNSMSEVAATNKIVQADAASGEKPDRTGELEKELALLKEQITRVEALLIVPDKKAGA